MQSVFASWSRSSGVYAQCDSYWAPSLIHCRSVVRSASVSGLCEFGGGMIASSSSEKMRRTSSLCLASPGTIASESTACSRKSNLKSPSTVIASGPWQAKHLSDRIDRMSRLNSSLDSPALQSESIARQTTDVSKHRCDIVKVVHRFLHASRQQA